jgi:Pyruvate/2-oxoacid:ferredoxin oxidoreductase delta subunit
MCEFCVQHGEGKKWYVQARNYSADLLNDARRRQFLLDGLAESPEAMQELADQFEAGFDRLGRAPGFIQRVLRWRFTSTTKKRHYGQVVPIEDVEQILEFVTSIVRLPCSCRQGVLHTEQRYCYGTSMLPPGKGPRGDFLRRGGYGVGPHTVELETLTKEEALANLREHEREGLCHTVWTFVTPFIGSVCNCDRGECLAMRSTITHGLPMFFRAEWVASVNADLCINCRDCLRACQFGAIGYSAARDKATIEPRLCYGCGVCRAHCPTDAIKLSDRRSIPVAAKLW